VRKARAHAARLLHPQHWKDKTAAFAARKRRAENKNARRSPAVPVEAPAWLSWPRLARPVSPPSAPGAFVRLAPSHRALHPWSLRHGSPNRCPLAASREQLHPWRSKEGRRRRSPHLGAFAPSPPRKTVPAETSVAGSRRSPWAAGQCAGGSRPLASRRSGDARVRTPFGRRGVQARQRTPRPGGLCPPSPVGGKQLQTSNPGSRQCARSGTRAGALAAPLVLLRAMAVAVQRHPAREVVPGHRQRQSPHPAPLVAPCCSSGNASQPYVVCGSRAGAFGRALPAHLRPSRRHRRSAAALCGPPPSPSVYARAAWPLRAHYRLRGCRPAPRRTPPTRAPFARSGCVCAPPPGPLGPRAPQSGHVRRPSLARPPRRELQQQWSKRFTPLLGPVPRSRPGTHAKAPAPLHVRRGLSGCQCPPGTCRGPSSLRWWGGVRARCKGGPHPPPAPLCRPRQVRCAPLRGCAPAAPSLRT
jgi:hypothetical protein